MKANGNKITGLSAKKFLQGRSGGKEAITSLKYTGGVGNLKGMPASRVAKLKGKPM